MIEVGEYVRTKDGDILIVKEYFKNTNEIILTEKVDGLPLYSAKRNNIELHSKDIVDVVKPGDYVNGKKINIIADLDLYGKGQSERMLFYDADLPVINGLNFYRNEDIETILTKEQFDYYKFEVKK